MLCRRLLLSALLVLAAALPLAAQGEIIEQILVKVNGEIITRTELEERQVNYLRQQNRQFSEDELKEVLAQITPQILASTIDEMLLVQRGRELGYRLSDEQFEDILERIRKENQIETDEQFQAALEQEGLTMEELRRQLERQALVARVQQMEVLGRVGITDVEARQYYDAHPEEFTTQATTTLREILIEIPRTERGVNVAAMEAARAEVEAVRARIAAGEDFAVVAGEVSDSSSRANGGLVGPINTAELSSLVREAIADLQPGEVSEPIETSAGFVLLKVEDRLETGVQPFEEVRDDVASRVFNQRRRAELEKYLKKLRTQAVIEWKNAELQKAYEAYMSDQASGDSE